MLIGVPSLWEKTDLTVHNYDDWQGWLLTYLTPICFPRCRMNQKKLFVYENDTYSKKRLDELLV